MYLEFEINGITSLINTEHIIGIAIKDKGLDIEIVMVNGQNMVLSYETHAEAFRIYERIKGYLPNPTTKIR